MNYKQDNYPASAFPNIMHRDYGKGVVLCEIDKELTPDVYSVHQFGTENWEFDWGTDTEVGQFSTLEEAEACVAECLAEEEAKVALTA